MATFEEAVGLAKEEQVVRKALEAVDDEPAQATSVDQTLEPCAEIHK